MPLSCCAIGCTNRHFPGTEKHFFAYQLMKNRESNGLQQLIERIGHPRREQDYAVTILQVVSIIINATVE